MLRSFIIVSLLAFTSACGVQNYDECVLKEMKGQSREMITHARDLCEAKFPFEKEIYGYKDNIDIGWWSTSDSIHLNISNNYGNYRITRYKASFSEKKCSDTDTYTLTKTFVFVPGNESASVYVGNNAEQYKCMQTMEVIGIRQ